MTRSHRAGPAPAPAPAGRIERARVPGLPRAGPMVRYGLSTKVKATDSQTEKQYPLPCQAVRGSRIEQRDY